VHDVAGTRRVCDSLAAIVRARAESRADAAGV
jgi:hypothetical protein